MTVRYRETLHRTLQFSRWTLSNVWRLLQALYYSLINFLVMLSVILLSMLIMVLGKFPLVNSPPGQSPSIKFSSCKFPNP